MEDEGRLNGGHTAKGNYVWGAALTLAWKQLVKDVIKSPVQIKEKDEKARRIARNFNEFQVDSQILAEQSFYAKAGFGNQTIRLINKQVSKKFPGKTTRKLEENVSPDAIVSYAYFLKNMQFQHPFHKQTMLFKRKEEPGFTAKNHQQKSQVLVHNYEDEDSFIIQLRTKKPDDHIFILKSKSKLQPEKAAQIVMEQQPEAKPMNEKDIFSMPVINIDCRRSWAELLGKHLGNKDLTDHHFGQVWQIIKLRVDEAGVRVENEGMVGTKKKRSAAQSKPRRLVLDRPFWLVIQHHSSHPYFIGYIEQLADCQ